MKSSTRAFWARALAVWALIAAAETVHGLLRGLLLVPAFGAAVAQRIGFAVGGVIVLGLATLTSRWLAAPSARHRWRVGVLWAALMAGFEVLIGRARGFDAARIAAEFDPGRGGPMGLGLLLMLAAPTLGAWLHGRIAGPAAAGRCGRDPHADRP